MPPTNPTSSVITEQLTRALGEAVIRMGATCLKTFKIIYSRRRSHLRASRFERSLQSSCMISIHAPRTHWASLAKCRSPIASGVRAFVRINTGKDA
jgi:hypothetical protein